MKMKRRLMSIIIGAVLAINIVTFSPIMSMHAYADSFGDFYYVIDNNEITITGYKGTESLITIPQTIADKTVTQIGDSAFEGTDIVNVTLPNSITKICYKAFAECKKLETINFPDGLKVIDRYAFSTCHSLERIELGNNIESIGECAFQQCISLSEITVPGTVKYIDDHIFHGCSSVEELVFEEGVISINETAALNMYSLEKVVIPSSVTEIGDYALGYNYYYPNYNRLSDVTIYGYSDTVAETYATDNGFDFVVLHKEEQVAVTGVSLDKTAVTLKEGEKIALTATITPDNANNKNLVWSSDNEAVAKVANGTITAIAEGNAKITVATEDGNKTASCTVTVTRKPVPVTGVSLDKISVTLKEGEKIALTATITPDNADNKNLVWSSDNENVAKVANGTITAVAKGSAKITVTTEDGNKTASCTVTVTSNDTSDQPSTPETPVVKPASKGDTIVDPATKITYIVTKSDVKSGTVAFVKPKNKKIQSVKIPDTVTIAGVTYKVTSIQKKAFSGCTKLKTVSIGKNVTTIGDKAFFKCTKISTITIPSKVSKIGKSAFEGCKKLKKIKIKTTKLTSKKVGSKAFKGTPSNTKVTVPKKSLKSYKKFLYKKGLNKKATIKK